jgi:hypothetical protein
MESRGISLVDQRLPLVNQLEIDCMRKACRRVDAERTRAQAKHKKYSFLGNIKKASYFGRVSGHLLNISQKNVQVVNGLVLQGLHALKHIVTRESVSGSLLAENGRLGRGQVNRLQSRQLQVLALKGDVVKTDGTKVSDEYIVRGDGTQIAYMWLAGEIKLSALPVCNAEKHYNQYTTGY